jgi:hypothetical protein
MASIYIQSARIVYGPGYVECECMAPVSTIIGDKAVTTRVVLIEGDALPQADWTDADLCAAVALVLQVDPVEVAVYEIPDP